MFSLGRKLMFQPVSLTKDTQPQDGIRLAIGEDGLIAFASGGFCALLGLSEDAVRGQKAANLMRSASGALAPGHHTLKAPSGQSFDFHFEWLEAPHQKRYLIGSPVSDVVSNQTDTLQALGQRLSQIDKTRDMQSQSRGMTQRLDLDCLFNLSKDLMIVMDEDGRIIRANDAFFSMTRLMSADLGSLNMLDLFHADDRPAVRNSLQAMGLRELGSIAPAVDFEARILSQDGEVRWVEWQQIRRDGLIYAAGRDTTPMRMQEDALSRREKQLTEAESIGRMGHWHWTIGQDCIEWSDEIYRIFGVKAAEFSPSIETMGKLIHRRDIDRVNQALQRAIIEQNDYDMEFRVNRPDGEIRYIRSEGRCECNEDDEVIALFGIMQDMTERTLQERQLREAKESAERAYAAKSQFLANMSHELRTPLNAIIGFSEMMQRQLLGPIGTEKYLEYIAGIRESGEHLLDLISDILDMSKIEAGKYELDLEEVKPAKVIKMAAHMMEGRALDAGVKIQVTADLQSERVIIADRRAVMQIVLNLLSNAVKFTKPGGSVTIEMNEGPDNLTLKITDTGIGIPANKLASITRPFEQVSSSYTREHQGSGLGLAITKELVDMHGGGLLIESQLEVGTTVTIRLPYDCSANRKKAKSRK